MYVNIFLCPLLDIYTDMQHSYIVELKYARYKDLENCVEELHREAVEQANRYADTETVKKAIGNTQLHKIVVVYKDYYSLCHPSGTLFPISSNIFRCSLPHASIIRMMGTSDSPSSVRNILSSSEPYHTPHGARRLQIPTLRVAVQVRAV